jgi:hypothetical protein
LRIFSSTAKVSEFLKYQHQEKRNSTVFGNCDKYLRLDNLVRYWKTPHAGKKFKIMLEEKRDFSFMDLYDKKTILKEEDINQNTLYPYMSI